MLEGQKNSSFVNFGLQGWYAAVCKCAVLWVEFLFFLRGEEKNKINPLKFVPSYLWCFLHLHTTCLYVNLLFRLTSYLVSKRKKVFKSFCFFLAFK